MNSLLIHLNKNAKKRQFFNQETTNYLIKSFKKANLEEKQVDNLFEWLSKSPRWSTIRVNNLIDNESIEKNIQSIQTFLESSYSNLNSYLNEPSRSRSWPKCSILNDSINECIIFETSTERDNDYQPEQILNKCIKQVKNAIIDLKCAQAVLRGADIFIPGIIALSLNAKANDQISIYVDLNQKCLKGADSNNYILKNSTDSVKFIANGWLLYERDAIFKNTTESLKSGVGIKIKELFDGSYIPSFDSLDHKKFYPQNLPSIVCARVLDPKADERILDMCSAPGGKTIHLADLVKNKGKITAFDKIQSKIKKMKQLCNDMEASCIECFCQDSTKIDFDKFKPESFDKILVDAPCSALGQRPLIYNDISVKQLASYISYQRMILDNAARLLKPGGYLVYSTCTITLEENEEQVSWFINKYPNIKLVDQEPFKYSINGGLPCKGLDDNQLKLVQRFMPTNEYQINSKSVFYDTNGFFIAKFIKN